MKYMLDLETLGKGSDAPIIQIGLAFWGRDEDVGGLVWGTHPGDYSQPEYGTVLWWVNQMAKGTPFPSRDYSLREALQALTDLMGKYPCEELWARSPSFDCVILRTAFEHYGMKEPWEFRAERDMRTLQALVPDLNYFPATGAHDALEDAKAQARWTVRALKRIKV